MTRAPRADKARAAPLCCVSGDLVQYPLDVMAGAADSVDVMAFHCYAGGPENQTVFHEAYPDTPIWFTECSQVGNENTPRQFLNDFTDNLNGIYFGNIDNWGQHTSHSTQSQACTLRSM